MENGVVKNGL